MPKLSIITINLNNKDGLRKTIESVISQTFEDFEYILIDGASTDGSVEVISQFETRLKYWISEPDNGIYHAMNKGIKKAKGDYCLFLNSGDYLDNSTILECIFESNHKEELLYGNFMINGFNQTFTMPDYLSFNTFLDVSIGHHASFIKRQLFESYGMYNENNKIVSDWEFFILVVFKYRCSYKHINKTVSHRQEGGISIDPKYHKIHMNERNEAIKQVLPEFHDTFMDYFNLKEELHDYKSSKVIQFIRKLQKSKINKIKNNISKFRFNRN